MGTLTPYLRMRATLAWAVLVVATIVSWILGTDHSFLFSDATVATSLVLGIAFLKVQLVGTYFMELAHAPRALALTFLAWVLLAGGAILGIYLWA